MNNMKDLYEAVKTERNDMFKKGFEEFSFDDGYNMGLGKVEELIQEIMNRNQIEPDSLKEKPIVLLHEKDVVGQKECIRQGLAMLIIPEHATDIEKEMIISGYKNCRFMVMERAKEIETSKTWTGGKPLEIRC